jgi:hypothetical protein
MNGAEAEAINLVINCVACCDESVWQNVIFHFSERGMRPVRRSSSLYCRELRPLLIFRGLFGGLSFDEVNGVDGRLLAKVKLLSTRVGLFALLRAIDVTLAATFLIKIHKVRSISSKTQAAAEIIKRLNCFPTVFAASGIGHCRCCICVRFSDVDAHPILHGRPNQTLSGVGELVELLRSKT